MFEINIDPTLISLGPLLISWHGFFTAVGLVFGIWIVANRLAPTIGISPDDVYGATPWTVIGGILGARLFHVVDQWSYYSAQPDKILAINEGGIAIYGGVIGGIIAGYLYVLKNKIPVAPFADAAVIGTIFGQGIGRIGDIINGEHHGKPYDGFWSVVYTHPNTLGEPGKSVHLAVGYEMLLDLLVFGALLSFWKKLPSGVTFWLYFVLYGAIRWSVGNYRVDTPVAFGLGQAQIIGIAGIIVGVPLAIWTFKRGIPLPSGAGYGDDDTDSGIDGDIADVAEFDTDSDISSTEARRPASETHHSHTSDHSHSHGTPNVGETGYSWGESSSSSSSQSSSSSESSSGGGSSDSGSSDSGSSSSSSD